MAVSFRGRLALGLVLLVAGGVLLAVSSGAPWFTGTMRGRSASLPGVGDVVVGGGPVNVPGSEIVAIAAPAGIAAVVLAAVAVLAGPRGRRAALGAALSLSLGTLLAVLFDSELPHARIPAGTSFTRAWGWWLAAGGGALATAGAAVSLLVAGKVPKLGMPEGPPDSGGRVHDGASRAPGPGAATPGRGESRAPEPGTAASGAADEPYVGDEPYLGDEPRTDDT